MSCEKHGHLDIILPTSLFLGHVGIPALVLLLIVSLQNIWYYGIWRKACDVWYIAFNHVNLKARKNMMQNCYVFYYHEMYKEGGRLFGFRSLSQVKLKSYVRT